MYKLKKDLKVTDTQNAKKGDVFDPKHLIAAIQDNDGDRYLMFFGSLRPFYVHKTDAKAILNSLTP